jgi:hypothetical protein
MGAIMKKIFCRILTAVFFLTLASCNGRAKEDAAYTLQVDGRAFVVEDTPTSHAEDIVIKDFLYTITGEFDKKYDILADIGPHAISIENEKKNMDEGVYIQSYNIHDITVLEENQYLQQETPDGETNPLFYLGLQERVAEFGLISYEVVSVNFSMLHSQKANEMGPQYGDGTYRRSFIVGKAPTDKTYKIYDFGMM